MTLKLKCSLGHSLAVRDALAGRRVRCPECGEVLLVHSNGDDAPIRTTVCPYCGERILAAAKKCKHCGEWVDEQYRRRASAPAMKFVTPAAIPIWLALTLNIYWLFWLARVFHELRNRGATRTTSFEAVGLLFVPFFNIYWFGRVCQLLARAVERAYEQDKKPAPNVGVVWTIPLTVLASWAVWFLIGLLRLPAPCVWLVILLPWLGFSCALCFVQADLNRLAQE